MTVQTELILTLDSPITKASDREAPVSLLTFYQQYVWPNGSGNNKANALFSDTRSLVGLGSETIDLRGGLVDSLCDTLTLVAVKALIIRSFPQNTGDIIFGPVGTDPFTAMFNDISDFVVVKPGGIIVFTAPNAVGYAVSATTKTFRITNLSTATSTYDLIVIGEDE